MPTNCEGIENMHKLTPLQSFNAMSKFLEKHYFETNSDDIGSMLSDMQFFQNGDPVDAAIWNDWMEIVANRSLLSEKEGFESMKIFLQNFYKYQIPAEIAALLNTLVIPGKENSMDTIAWKTWIKSIEETKNEPTPYMKLTK